MPTERNRRGGNQTTAYNWLKIGAVALSYFLVEVFAVPYFGALYVPMGVSKGLTTVR